MTNAVGSGQSKVAEKARSVADGTGEKAAVIERERSNGVEIVTLNRPPVNALNLDLVTAAERTLAELENDESLLGIVLTGEGSTFCAGLDLKALPGYDREQQRALLDGINRLLLRLYGFPRPVVAAVNGSAVAGGLVLVLACDYRLGIDTSCRLFLAEVQVGVPYPVGAREVVRNELSPPTARLLMLAGLTLGTKSAIEHGVLDEHQPPTRLLSAAEDRVREFAESPRGAFARIKLQNRAEALERIRRAVEEGDEPLHDGWFDPHALRGR